MTYRWTGSHAYRDHANDRVIEPGEEFDEDRIAEAHPYDVEEVDEDGDDESPDEAEGEGHDLPDGVDPDDVEGAEGELPFNPEDYSIPELEERLQEVDDPAAVVALRNLEGEQEERKGADDAFAERLEEIGAENADE